ncbi:MAG: ATP-binding protein [Oscillospiraceae bacterium]|nr:ATP-binding protein [Oscillospiraceae bacterium]
MRIIPKKTKVSTEFFRGLSIADILVGFFGVVIMFLVFISSLPGKLWIEIAIFFVFGLLLARIDSEPNYIFLLQLLRHLAHLRRFQKLPKREQTAASAGVKGKTRRSHRRARGEEAEAEEPADEEETPSEEAEGDESSAQMSQTAHQLREKHREERKAQKQKERERKAEDKFLKNKNIPEEEKEPIRERRRIEAEERYAAAKIAEQQRKRKDIRKMTLITAIEGGFIHYGSEYYGAAIEIPAVEFRFFSENRRTNAIDRAFGSVIRSVGSRFAANIVKLEQPMILDEYIDSEYDKIDALKQSYERGVFSEEELKSRIEVIYDRINDLRRRNMEDKVLLPHYYLVLFDSDRRQLENQIEDALAALRQGEMSPHRLDDKELAVFLRYVNSVDFDERGIDEVAPEDYADYILPESLELKMRTAEVGSIITHNFRVTGYPLMVSDAWGASFFDMPGTKVVMKFSQMDREKSIRAIDRSISELNSQLNATSVSSRIIELQTHIETLSDLLSMLQNNNESLVAMNMYVTAYDIAATRENKLLVPQPPPSDLPHVRGMKKDIKRTFREQGFRLSDMTAMQFEAFVATQVNAYDPFLKKARGVPGSTLAGVFPWVYAGLRDKRGLNLGSSDGLPAFVDFFRRDSERVNSNMVIVGKSGGGKSFATKSILTNLAADDAKIFVLDPENEYSELAGNLKGKFINLANVSHGRINPFHIITSLEDDEASDGQETNSYSAHLQFLEEFFRQILPDVDQDALEYLNTLVNRVYNRKGIDQYTPVTRLRAEDYPIFDDLYDCVLEEFQRTTSDYLKGNLRVLMNHISKFSTGGRNANIWNGPSTLSTVENLIVFNFQTLLANRNNTVANAQMLLVLKYLDNEIIKNREYNLKYGASRKIIVVIDEAHVFIDAKYPLALDFMFQLAKRIRKYNGMQIVITQNIKDFVGSEELARKSTAIINACQYSLIFSLSPNDMHDLCTLYEKAGGINENEQEQIISAPRGQAFVVTGPSSRATVRIKTPEAVEEMFTHPYYESHYFSGEDGAQVWESTVAESRERREAWEIEQSQAVAAWAASDEEDGFVGGSQVEIIEIEEEEALPAASAAETVVISEEETPAARTVQDTAASAEKSDLFSPEALQRYGFEALVGEIRRAVRQEVASEMSAMGQEGTASLLLSRDADAPPHTERLEDTASTEAADDDWFSDIKADGDSVDDWFGGDTDGGDDDWFEPKIPASEAKSEPIPQQEKKPPAADSDAEESFVSAWYMSDASEDEEDDWFNPAPRRETAPPQSVQPDEKQDAWSVGEPSEPSRLTQETSRETSQEGDSWEVSLEDIEKSREQDTFAPQERDAAEVQTPDVPPEEPEVYEITLDELLALAD